MPATTDPLNSSVVVPLKPAVDADGTPTIIGPSARTPMAEALALSAGSTLGHFEILAPLGAGGMASVLKARDTHLGRLVALKILPPGAAADGDAVARFKHEARAAAKLDHEHVARVFFSGEDRGLHFIAFEFVEGETLRARIDRLGRLTPAESVRFLLHCAAGLRHLNDRGVVHRDIKPSNVVVTPDGRAKLIDLGLARHAESFSVNGGVTQSGVTLGTFDYISPEQARDPRTADVRSDIYSLGCTFYHALTGRPPVPEGTAAVKLSAQQLSAPTDPRELNPDVSDELAMVLNRMLGKDPARRYQTPAELIAELSDVARQLGLAVDGADEPDPTGPSPRFAAANPRVPLSGIVAGVVLLAAALVVASLTGSRTPTPPTLPWIDFPPPPSAPLGVLEVAGPPWPGPPPSGPTVAATVAELIAAARAEVAHVQLVPGKVYDLTDTPGLFFAGRTLIVECTDPRTPAVVRVAVSPAADPPVPRAGGFTVERAEAVTLRGIHFEFSETAAPADKDVPQEPVGVAVSEADKLDLHACTWDEPDPKDGKAKAASVTALRVARSGRAKATALTARHAFFNTRRWTAVGVTGPVAGVVSECGFVTGMVAVRLAPDPTFPDAASTLDVKNSTFLLDSRAAAILADSLKAAVSVGYCVFAAPALPDPAAMTMVEGDRKPVTLRVTGGDAAAVTFAAVPGEPSGYFRTDIPAAAVGPDAVPLDLPPWKTVPPVPPKAAPFKVLELNPAVRAVRVSRPAGVHILGVTRLPTADDRLYADWPPGRALAAAPKPGVKVWYPNPPAAEKGQLPNGVYEDLQKAVDQLRADDVLHVRATGPVKVPTVLLARKGARVVMQPEDGFEPVLVPAADGPLFRIEEGELRLERLPIHLTLANESLGRPTAAVTLAGGKRCAFAECTVTVDETVGDATAVAQVLPPAGGLVPEYRPDVRFDKCLIRGTGRLVRMPAAVPATVAVTHSILALAGPVVDLGPPDMKPADGAALRLRLSHVTALLAAPLVDATLTDTPDPTFVPVQVDADASVFAPLDTFTGPLLRATHADPAAVERYLQWSALTPNRFANFPPLATFVEVPPKKLAAADWVMFSKETNATLVKVKFADPPATARGLLTVAPADLAIPGAAPGDEFGAKTTGLPPPPAPQEK